MWAQPRIVAFSPNGNFLAVGSNSLTSSIISLYSVRNKSAFLERKWNESYLENYKEAMFSSLSIGEQLKLFGLGSILDGTFISRSLSFSADGSNLASVVSSNDKIRIWRVGDGKLLQTLSGNLDSILYAPNGAYLVSAGGNSIRLWNAEKMAVLAVWNAKQFIDHITFSPNSRFLATGGRGNSVSIWQISTNGGKLVSTLTSDLTAKDSDVSIRGIAFSPDGQFVAIAHTKNTNSEHTSFASSIDLWNVNENMLVKKLGTRNQSKFTG